MTNRLANTDCIITGTGGSTGRAAALAFAREGDLLVGSGLRADDREALSRQQRGPFSRGRRRPRGRRSLVLVACAVGMTAAGRAEATNGTRLTGFGPVQDAMGGVGVGATLDAATIISNPAGLADLGARVDGAVSWLQPSVSYRATESQLPPGFTGAVVARPSTTIDSNRGGSPLPFLAGVILN